MSVGVEARLQERLNSDTGANYITGTDGGSTQLRVDQTRVHVVPPSSGVHTIQLPPVSMCANMIYSIYSNGNDTGTIVVQDADETPTPYVSDALTADKDVVVVFSDGFMFHQLIDVTTP